MSEWRAVPLGFCVNEVKRKNLGGHEQNLLSLSYGNIIRKDIGSAEGLLPESFDTYNVVEAGDTALRLTDLQNDQRSLRVGLVRETGIITSAYVSLRPNVGIEPRFVNYYLKNMDFRKDFYALGAGVRQSLKFDELRRIAVPVPPLATQRAIADYLDNETARIDALIAKKQRMIELLNEQVRERLRELAFGPDFVSSLRPGRFHWWAGITPAQWRIQRLVDLVRIFSGVSFDSQNINQPGASQTLIRIGDVAAGHSSTTIEGPIPESTRVADGDVVLALSGDFVCREWQGGPAVLNQRTCALRPRDGVGLLSSYLALVLPSCLDYLHEMTHSTTLKNLSTPDLLSQRVPVPPLEEQRKIVLQASEISGQYRRLQNAIDSQIELLRERRQALITAVVTGELEVPGASA